MIPIDMKEGARHPTKKSGVLEILKYTDRDNVLVSFLTTGYTKVSGTRAIRIGSVKDPYYPLICNKGFIGEGPYSSTADRVAYDAWRNMLDRCYGSSGNYPTYVDCTVVPAWFNFQNFAEWFNSQKNSYTKGYELDKDILVKGKKVYSPDTCSIVPKAENLREAHR
ncbi:HNH endonuclease [Vibrio phage D432]